MNNSKNSFVNFISIAVVLPTGVFNPMGYGYACLYAKVGMFCCVKKHPLKYQNEAVQVCITGEC